MNADIISRVKSMVEDAEEYRDQLEKDRRRAVEYYDGKMVDTPSDKGRSAVVSRDFRATVKKALPSILRTILGNDEVVEYKPVGQDDEEGSSQASDFINYVVFPESCGPEAVHDAIHDALRLRNGVLKWWWEEKKEAKVSMHSGLDEMAFTELVSPKEVEVLQHSEREEEMPGPDGQPMMTMVHDVKIKRMMVSRCARVAAVPLDEFLISKTALSTLDSPLVGQVTKRTRSDLVAMGYDKEKVFALKQTDEDDTEEQTRRNVALSDDEPDEPAMQEIDYYELYVRTDTDDDGIAELRRMCFGGDITEKGMLADDECDEVQFCTVKCERKPHQWEGTGIGDDVMEIQRIKTVLLRQTLDNIYWQNNLQPVVDMDAVENPDAVFNPSFGQPIQIKQGRNAREAVAYNPVPFVAEKSFQMLEYLDNESRQRTGISDASAGLPADALQNMTAKASAMMEQAGIGQTEQIVRTIANDLRPMFCGLLKLIIRHQDKPRTVRLRDKWVEFDPRHWNASMDATVNTGLGAGTRERDMAVMMNVVTMQDTIIARLGADNPFIKPMNVYNARVKLLESAGLRSPTLYITEPNEQEVQAKLAAANDPANNPEMIKVQAQKEIETVKAQAAAEKEKAQAEADIIVKEKIAQIEAMQAEHAAALAKATADEDRALKQYEIDRKLEIEQMKMSQTREIELMKLGAKDTENGPVSKDDERHDAFTGSIEGLKEMLAGMNKPRRKRIVRDMNNDVVGVEDIEDEAPETIN
jgi:hypothetical protein